MNNNSNNKPFAVFLLFIIISALLDFRLPHLRRTTQSHLLIGGHLVEMPGGDYWHETPEFWQLWPFPRMWAKNCSTRCWISNTNGKNMHKPHARVKEWAQIKCTRVWIKFHLYKVNLYIYTPQIAWSVFHFFLATPFFSDKARKRTMNSYFSAQ